LGKSRNRLFNSQPEAGGILQRFAIFAIAICRPFMTERRDITCDGSTHMSNMATTSSLSTFEALAGGSLAKKAVIVLAGSLFLAGMAQVSVPFFPVPMTLGTLAVMLIGVTFGARMATATIALYLVEGLAGLPVFSNFGSGVAKFMGPTGGYLVGYLIAAAVMGFMADRGITRSWTGMIAALFAGEVIIMALGYGWLASLIGTEKAWLGGVYPFILGDTLKLALAALIAKGVLKGILTS
jgi:biotin transport system substrate-specific component